MVPLSERQKQILNLAVSLFIKTGEPVASRTLVKTYQLPVGPATIRNEMADLEEMGFLEQPHTSAGRVPTDKGYRSYVDGLNRGGLTDRERSQLNGLEERYFAAAAEIQGLLTSAARILSEATQLVGVVSVPRLDEGYVERLQLVTVGRRRVMVVLATSTGLVETHVVGVDVDIPQDKLDGISRVFNENFSRASIKDLLGDNLMVLEQIQEAYRSAVAKLMKDFMGSMDTRAAQRRDILMEGANQALAQPEFAASADRAREILQTLEMGSTLGKLIGEPGETSDFPFVRIGVESRQRDLRELSVVIAPYGADDLCHGVIGIIGPRRMNYGKAMASVAHVSKELTRRLSEV